MNLSASYSVADNIAAKVDMINVLYEAELTGGNPHTDETRDCEMCIVIARSMPPIRIRASLNFGF